MIEEEPDCSQLTMEILSTLSNANVFVDQRSQPKSESWNSTAEELFQQLKQHIDILHKRLNYQNIYIKSTARLQRSWKTKSDNLSQELEKDYCRMTRSYRYWRKRTKKLKNSMPPSGNDPYDTLQQLYAKCFTDDDGQQQEGLSPSPSSSSDHAANTDDNIILLNPFDYNYTIEQNSSSPVCSQQQPLPPPEDDDQNSDYVCPFDSCPNESNRFSKESKQSFIDHMSAHFLSKETLNVRLNSCKQPDKILLFRTPPNPAGTIEQQQQQMNCSLDSRVKVIRSGYVPDSLLQQMDESLDQDNQSQSNVNTVRLENIKKALTNAVLGQRKQPASNATHLSSSIQSEFFDEYNNRKKFQCQINGCTYRSFRLDCLQTHIRVVHENKSPLISQIMPKSNYRQQSRPQIQKALETLKQQQSSISNNNSNSDQYRRKFQCSIDGCTNQFTTDGGLQTHIKLIHRYKPKRP